MSFLFERIGHDGSKVLYPDLPDPQARRGFHPHELVECVFDLGWSCTPFELFPKGYVVGKPERIYYSADDETGETNLARFSDRIFESYGVLECVGDRYGHAFANCGGALIDPDDGSTFKYGGGPLVKNLTAFRYWQMEPRR